MKLNKKQLTLLIECILVFIVSNIGLALLWMSRDVDITGGVDKVGAIAS